MEVGDDVMLRGSYLLGCQVSELMEQRQNVLNPTRVLPPVSKITTLGEPAHHVRS